MGKRFAFILYSRKLFRNVSWLKTDGGGNQRWSSVYKIYSKEPFKRVFSLNSENKNIDETTDIRTVMTSRDSFGQKPKVLNLTWIKFSKVFDIIRTFKEL